jgi:hypothetical protein
VLRHTTAYGPVVVVVVVVDVVVVGGTVVVVGGAVVGGGAVGVLVVTGRLMIVVDVVVGALEDPEWTTMRAMATAAMAMITATTMMVRPVTGDCFLGLAEPLGAGGRLSSGMLGNLARGTRGTRGICGCRLPGDQRGRASRMVGTAEHRAVDVRRAREQQWGDQLCFPNGT